MTLYVLLLKKKTEPYRWLTEWVELDGRAGAPELVVFEGPGETVPSVLQLHLHSQPGDVIQIKVDLVEAGQGEPAGSLGDFYDINISAVVGVIYSNQFWKIGSNFQRWFLLKLKSDRLDHIFHIEK